MERVGRLSVWLTTCCGAGVCPPIRLAIKPIGGVGWTRTSCGGGGSRGRIGRAAITDGELSVAGSAAMDALRLAGVGERHVCSLTVSAADDRGVGPLCSVGGSRRSIMDG